VSLQEENAGSSSAPGKSGTSVYAVRDSQPFVVSALFYLQVQ